MTNVKQCTLVTTTDWPSNQSNQISNVDNLMSRVAQLVEKASQNGDASNGKDLIQLTQKAKTYVWHSYVEMQKRLQNPLYDAQIQSQSGDLVWAAEQVLRNPAPLARYGSPVRMGIWMIQDWWHSKNPCEFVNEMLQGKNAACITGTQCQEIEKLAVNRATKRVASIGFKPQLALAKPFKTAEDVEPQRISDAAEFDKICSANESSFPFIKSSPSRQAFQAWLDKQLVQPKLNSYDNPCKGKSVSELAEYAAQDLGPKEFPDRRDACAPVLHMTRSNAALYVQRMMAYAGAALINAEFKQAFENFRPMMTNAAQILDGAALQCVSHDYDDPLGAACRSAFDAARDHYRSHYITTLPNPFDILYGKNGQHADIDTEACKDKLIDQQLVMGALIYEECLAAVGNEKSCDNRNYGSRVINEQVLTSATLATVKAEEESKGDKKNEKPTEKQASQKAKPVRVARPRTPRAPRAPQRLPEGF
ncbi:MAG: hypothetical protein COV45_04045 [Deltaproteobacteria bacterium CG11_big_fil_rev_8_21_14_0_20_47_16]|nr:MAG: hypothetical protein COV45_04045 [Deltaproteobacteria bacterium CG11_big_fil_rev_8_21_14_0_20_47_16]